MASIGRNEGPVEHTFFEIPIDQSPSPEFSRNEKLASPIPKGGLTFSVGLDESQSNSENLQMAAENLRLKSEKRRSDMALKVSQEKNLKKKFDEEIMQLDELAPPEEPLQDDVASDTGTYTIRLDSAELRERRETINMSEVAANLPDQNSATESTEEYEVPSDVTNRVSEWFSRNDAAQSRQSEPATDNNLEDIRQKAKDRIKERNTTQAKGDSSKIVLTREERKSKTGTVPNGAAKAKNNNPPVRLTRAMLLRKNRALGIKTDPEKTEPVKEDKKVSPTSATSGQRKVSARLENLSKPKARGPSEISRQRSFSHEDAKVYRGRTVNKDSKRKTMDPKDTKKTSRSSSLTRGGLGATSLSQPKPKPSRKTDPLSQSLRVEPTKSSRNPARGTIPVAKRSSSLSRSTTTSTLRSKSERTPKERISRQSTKISSKPTSVHQSWAGPPQSSSSSSRLSHSRPATASSQREISHEKSILYSVLILSNNCLQKTFEILNDLGGDASEFESEFAERTPIAERSPHDVESVLSNLCSLDKCLSRIRNQQKENLENSKSTEKNDKREPVADGDTFTIDSLQSTSLVTTKDEIPLNLDITKAESLKSESSSTQI